jgi:mono/diheme cytochrome c family protein
MNWRRLLYGGLITVLLSSAALLAQPKAKKSAASSGKESSTAPAGSTVRTADDGALRLEGEQRYNTNCGRCHQAPHKFPPRMMATIIRHMRVRATLTEEDMRLILGYMTQ